MLRSSILSLFFSILFVTICRAQSDTTEEAMPYRFSIALTPSLSVPTGTSGLGPDDPFSTYDSSAALGGLAVTGNVRIIDALSLEFLVEAFGLGQGSGSGHSDAQRAMIEAAYPDYFIVSNWVSDRSLFAVGGGLSYRIPIGPLMLEPSLLACYAGIDSMASSIELKQKGTNEYLSVTHQTEGREGLALIPSLAIRYGIDGPDSRWGVQLRGSYLYARFDIEHTVTEKLMTKVIKVESFTARQQFDAVNVGFGVYYYLF